MATNLQRCNVDRSIFYYSIKIQHNPNDDVLDIIRDSVQSLENATILDNLLIKMRH